MTIMRKKELLQDDDHGHDDHHDHDYDSVSVMEDDVLVPLTNHVGWHLLFGVLSVDRIFQIFEATTTTPPHLRRHQQQQHCHPTASHMALRMNPIFLCLYFMILFQETRALAPSHIPTTGKTTMATIRICQNKHCQRKWTFQQTMPQILTDLLPPHIQVQIQVQVTGCLSECAQGPNLVLSKNNNIHTSDNQQDKPNGPCLLQRVSTPSQLVDHLEQQLGIEIPSKLVAAVNVMEKAGKADSFVEQERFLSSVIRVLQNDSNTSLCQSMANVHAHILRAQVFCEQGMIDLALEDLVQAETLMSMGRRERIEETVDDHLLGRGRGSVLLGRLWRTRADCYLALGRLVDAQEALRQWAIQDPLQRTKAVKEIQALSLLLLSDVPPQP